MKKDYRGRVAKYLANGEVWNQKPVILDCLLRVNDEEVKRDAWIGFETLARGRLIPPTWREDEENEIPESILPGLVA